MAQKILVVDDDRDNLKIIFDLLKASNPAYQLMQAFNGAAALKIVEKEMPDLVLLDWIMPIMDGMQTLVALKSNEQTEDIPVIMQTGESEDTKLKEAFDAGALDYIKKPISALELQARVTSALALTQAQKKTEELLLNILPENIADELRSTGQVTPQPYEKVSVLFTDFKGFSNITQSMSPIEIVEHLNQVFLKMEQITRKHGLEKIKTIGDAYMCAGGLPIANDTNPLDAVKAAMEIQDYMDSYKEEQTAQEKPFFECRIGIHTGKVVAGVIGNSKFAYDIWGSSVNAASRMESNGEPGKVNISGATYEYIKDHFECEHRGKLPIKNMGEVDMYFVLKPIALG